MRAILLPILAFPLILGGCATVAAEYAADRFGLPIAAKTVAAKREPDVLVATDFTSCRVSGKEWKNTEVGDRFICRHYSPGDEAWSADRGERE